MLIARKENTQQPFLYLKLKAYITDDLKLTPAVLAITRWTKLPDTLF